MIIRCTLVLLVALGLGTCANASTKSVDEHAAKRIDSSLGSYRKVTKEFDTGTDRGGALTGYLRGRSIVKIVAEVEMSSKDYEMDYYFRNDRLAMVTKIERQYGANAKTNDLDFTRPQSTKVRTWYFDNGQPAGTKSERSDEVSYLHDAVWLSRAVLSRAKSIDAVKWVTGG